jgi:curved DNA-binding protein CbpA
MHNDNTTFYDILDISPNASPQEVREAYVRIKSTYNRDSVALYTLITPEERDGILRQIEEAYVVLSDPQKRRDYDQNYGHVSTSEAFLPSSSSAKVISIDRVPPMENSNESEDLLIPPSTDFHKNEEAPSVQHNVPSTPRYESNSIRIQSNTPSPAPRFFRPKSERRSPYSELTSELIQEIEIETEWKGSFLRKVRDSYKISLEEMATITKVTKTYLNAIEEENFKKLPAPVYIRGFVIQVAKVLKLPHDKVANAYLARYQKTHPTT